MLGRRGSSNDRILFHYHGCTILGWAGLGVVPSAESVGHDRTRHADDGSHLDLSAQSLEGCNGADQTLGV